MLNKIGWVQSIDFAALKTKLLSVDNRIKEFEGSKYHRISSKAVCSLV